MKSWTLVIRSELGVALPLALLALMMLSVISLSFMSMAGTEPAISANLTDTTRTRYLAEAGIEWAFDQLVVASGQGGWGPLLTNGTPPGTMTSGQALPGLPNTFGTFTVTVRNDNQPGDNKLTGVPPEPAGNVTTDANGIVIVTATGTLNGATPQQMQRQIQVVIKRAQLPGFPGAVNLPGLQADTGFRCGAAGAGTCAGKLDVDGRDWLCTANCSDPNPANRTYAVNADQSKMKFSMAVQPGIQQDLNITYEAEAEYGVTEYDAQNANNFKGKCQITGSFVTGLNTVAAPTDPSEVLNPAKMQSFLTQLAANSGTQILQSTKKCPMVLWGVSGQPNKPQLENGTGPGCGLNQTLDLGTPDNPKLIYFKGELDTTSKFQGLGFNGTDAPGGTSKPLNPPIRGAGILVVEDGDLSNWGEFQWDGVVIVTGRYMGFGARKDSKTTVYGALVSNETIWNEGLNRPYGDFNLLDQASATFRYSQQTVNIARGMRPLHTISSWREF